MKTEILPLTSQFLETRLTLAKVYKLPEKVYQVMWSIAKAMATKEDKMFYMKRTLDEYIEEKHPGYKMEYYTELMVDEARAIHPQLEWGIYYSLQYWKYNGPHDIDLLEQIKKLIQ